MAVIQRLVPGWANQIDGGPPSSTVPSRTFTRWSSSPPSGRARGDRAYTTRELDDEHLGRDLARVGLELDRWITDDGNCVADRPRTHTGA